METSSRLPPPSKAPPGTLGKGSAPTETRAKNRDCFSVRTGIAALPASALSNSSRNSSRLSQRREHLEGAPWTQPDTHDTDSTEPPARSLHRSPPRPPPGNLPACQGRGFGKEATLNHSCGWDVVSILSPSFLLLPRLYQTSTRASPAQQLLRRALLLGCPADRTVPLGARNPATSPALHGRSQFGYDPSATRTQA